MGGFGGSYLAKQKSCSQADEREETRQLSVTPEYQGTILLSPRHPCMLSEANDPLSTVLRPLRRYIHAHYQTDKELMGHRKQGAGMSMDKSAMTRYMT